MANVYWAGQKKVEDSGILNLTIKALLLETGCTFTATHATLTAVVAVGGGELDASSGYARQTPASLATSIDSGVEVSSDPVVFTGVDSADLAIAMLIYIHIDGTDANDIPWLYCDAADVQFSTGVPTALTVTPHADGWRKLT